MDFTLPLIVVMACTITLVTVVVYERLLREAQAENERLMSDCDLFSELLNEAVEESLQRHPAVRSERNLKVINGGAS